MDFGDFVGKVVGPLVEDAGAGRSEELNVGASVRTRLVQRGEIVLGRPHGSCGLDEISFQRQPAALKRSSFSTVGENVWFQSPVKALLVWV